MKSADIELLRTDKKKGLATVKKRIMGALKNPCFIDIRPNSVLYDDTHAINFTIFSSEGRVEGTVTYKPHGN